MPGLFRQTAIVYMLKNGNDGLHLGHVECLFCLITGKSVEVSHHVCFASSQAKVLKCPITFVLPCHRQSVEVSWSCWFLPCHRHSVEVS